MQRRKQSVGLGKLELPTSCLQNKRSFWLNYNPKIKVLANVQPLIYKNYEWRVHKRIYVVIIYFGFVNQATPTGLEPVLFLRDRQVP